MNEEKSPILPEHMTLHDRNRRLYETLLGMGLVVCPTPNKDDPSKIDNMVVSAGLSFTETPTEARPSPSNNGEVLKLVSQRDKPAFGDGYQKAIQMLRERAENESDEELRKHLYGASLYLIQFRDESRPKPTKGRRYRREGQG